uniref:ribonuclease H n=1 Tax=Denticeps clupeoides TaxID=299321 RepID=A0AAY4DCC8_9TELE
MVNRDWGTTLDSIITLATSIDRRHAERDQERRSHAPFHCAPAARLHDAPRAPPPRRSYEPMQMSRARPPLTPQERKRREEQRRCYYCGEPNHLSAVCPNRRIKPHPSGKNPRFPEVWSPLARTKAIPRATTRCSLPIIVCWNKPRPGHHQGRALVDSGAAMNLIDVDLATRLQLPVSRCDPPRAVMGLDGSPLGSGRILFQTKPLLICLEPNHVETVTFYLTTTPHDPIVLGYPWLTTHEPHIDWTTGTIKQWGRQCIHHQQATPPNRSGPTHVATVRLCHAPQPMPCSLPRTKTPVQDCKPRPLAETTPLRDDVTQKLPEATPRSPLDTTSSLLGVPECYHDLAAVFDKDKAAELPPHRPYDLAIDLLPGALPPRGRLYSLSLPERKAMDEYITASLASGIIRPSTSPAAAPFFFVGKKDGGLRPCIDYRKLNAITKKNRYPLPLLNTAFELLAGATVFTKLDLRNAYHLVRIREGDEWKTGFITPSGHYEYLVMPFGLSNSPAAFQALVNDVLRDMLDQFVFVYLDDILIYSPNLSTHIS